MKTCHREEDANCQAPSCGPRPPETWWSEVLRRTPLDNPPGFPSVQKDGNEYSARTFCFVRTWRELVGEGTCGN